MRQRADDQAAFLPGDRLIPNECRQRLVALESFRDLFQFATRIPTFDVCQGLLSGPNSLQIASSFSWATSLDENGPR